jgi:hypothetical protein
MVEKATFFKGPGVEGDPGRIAGFARMVGIISELLWWFFERQYVHPSNRSGARDQETNNRYGGHAEKIYHALLSGRRLEVHLSIRGWTSDLNVQITVFSKARNVLADIGGMLVSNRTGESFRSYIPHFRFMSATFR